MADSMDIPSTPSTLRQFQMSRKQRIKVHTLRSIGWKYHQITFHLSLTMRQVAFPATHPRTPRKCSGRPPKITKDMMKELIQFISASAHNRRMQYAKIPAVLGWDVTESAIRYALKKEGYSRCMALRKPPISLVNQRTRLLRAQPHVTWTREQ